MYTDRIGLEYMVLWRTFRAKKSSNNIVSGFWETVAFKDATEEMCFYINKPNSLPEKLEYTKKLDKKTGQKTKKWRQTKAKNKINCILLKKLYTTKISITASFQLVSVN